MDTLFYVVMFAVGLNVTTSILSIARPDLRVWPPPCQNSWQFYYSKAVTLVVLVGFLALGIIDNDSFLFLGLVRFVIGIPLVACIAFAIWGYVTLGVYASQGLGSELITGGAYRYSRNPQNVGLIPGFFGFAILCNSSLALFAAFFLGGLAVLVSYVEESWCRQHFGDLYDEYVTRVPRFLWFR